MSRARVCVVHHVRHPPHARKLRSERQRHYHRKVAAKLNDAVHTRRPSGAAGCVRWLQFFEQNLHVVKWELLPG